MEPPRPAYDRDAGRAADRLEGERDRPARIVVWAHNSHLGDARATELGEAGELNVGQLVRERWGEAALLVGFTTDRGTVTAASDWGGRAERKRVRPSLPGSYEHLFEGLEPGAFVVRPRSVVAVLGGPRLERAIGVVYRPDSERQSHYFHARMAHQFDVVVHFDETSAVEPLDSVAAWAATARRRTIPPASEAWARCTRSAP